MQYKSVAAQRAAKIEEITAAGGPTALADRMRAFYPPQAKRASIVQDINRFRQGRSIDLYKIVALARAADVSTDWLLGLTDVRRPSAIGWDEDALVEAVREYVIGKVGYLGWKGMRDLDPEGLPPGARILALYREEVARRAAAEAPVQGDRA